MSAPTAIERAAVDYSPARSRDPGLDFVRAAAILLVLAAHVSLLFSGVANPSPVLHLLGYLGVELFFVLSGFLIGRILLRTVVAAPGLVSLRAFWLRRWLRTLPAYYTVLLAVSLAAAAGLGAAAWRREDLSFVVFLQNAFPSAAGSGFFAVAWSLAIEEWFYLLTPLLLLAALKLPGSRERGAVFACCALLVAAPPAARACIAARSAAGWWEMRGMILPRFDAIGFGVLVAAVRRYEPRFYTSWRGRRAPCLLLGAAGLAALAPFVAAGPGAGRGFLMKTVGFSVAPACFALMLPIFALERPREPGRLGRAAMLLSGISYSVYLVHWDLLLGLRRFHPNPGSWTASALYAAAVLAAILAAALLLHRVVEKPAMDLRERLR